MPNDTAVVMIEHRGSGSGNSNSNSNSNSQQPAHETHASLRNARLLGDLVHLKLREHACPGVAYQCHQTKGHLKTHIKTVHEKRRDHTCPHCPLAPSGRRAA